MWALSWDNVAKEVPVAHVHAHAQFLPFAQAQLALLTPGTLIPSLLSSSCRLEAKVLYKPTGQQVEGKPFLSVG